MGFLNLNLRLGLNFNSGKEVDLTVIYKELLPFYKEILNSKDIYNVTYSGRELLKVVSMQIY